jgi:S-DNA-T family DNA segregation ATPase FtsK/SpoIIIE
MTSKTLVATPDPDEPTGARVLDFPTFPVDGTDTEAHVVQDAVPAGFVNTTDAPGTDLESVAEVVDGELVEDEIGRVLVDPTGPDTDHRPLPERLAALAAGRRAVIAPWLRSGEEFTAVVRWAAGHVGHTAAFHAARTPIYAGRLALRSPRGAVRVLSHSAGWVFDSEGAALRVEAVTKGDRDGYLKLVEVRRERVRGRLLVAVLSGVLLTAGVLVLLGFASGLVQVAVCAAVIGVLGWVGTPADKNVLGGRAVVTAKAQRLTSDIVVRALGALGIGEINKAMAKGGGGITFPSPITRDGPGWRAEVDLPYGVVVTDIMDRRDRLASGLRRPMGCVWPEPVHEEHAGRLVLWVGDQDMSRATPKPWPLARHGQADIFKELPFGTDPRGRVVSVLLMFASVLIGAMPRYGKTFALRVLLLATALDPTVQMRVFELKGTGDLSALGKVAHHYGSGIDDDTIEAAVCSLRQLVNEELPRRAKTIQRLPKELCPENKVTPQLAGNRQLGLFPIVIAVDECQELFTHAKFGGEAAELCTRLIKLGPALGIMLVLATQRPDKDSLPTGVSANVGIRFCLRVMGQTENDMVLGTSSYKNGVRATTFTMKDKGIGYLVGASEEPQIVRGSYLDGPAADRITDRARGLREAAGTLSGYAIGETDVPDAPRRSVLDDVTAVFGLDEDRLWSEVIVTRLADHEPDTYRGWTPNALATALKPFGITPGQVPMRGEDGSERNRRGYRLDALRDARTAHDKAGDVDAE